MLKSDDVPSCRASNNVHIWDDSDESIFLFHLISGGTPGSQVAERRKLGDRSKAVNTEFCFITFFFVLLLNSALMFLRGKISCRCCKDQCLTQPE